MYETLCILDMQYFGSQMGPELFRPALRQET
jgi:hypothetical protein